MIDEEQPLLRPDRAPQSISHHAAPYPDADFDPDGDQDDPLQWPMTYRWGLVSLLALMAFTVTFTCISVVPVAGPIIADLSPDHTASKSASVLLVTIWELGEAAGPLFIAPLSEVYGRYPVFNAANTLFIIGVLLATLSQTPGMLVCARFLTGCAVASNVLNPSVIGDIFPPESRGSAVSLVMLAPLIGGAVGPAIAGAIAQSSGWRQIMCMSLALAIFCEILFLTCFRETYKPVILRRRQNIHKRHATSSADEQLEPTPTGASEKATEPHALRTAIIRPLKVFAGSFVLQILSLYGAVVFSLFYIMSTTLPEILREQYHLSPTLVGSSLISFSIGSLLGVLTCNLLLDRIYRHLQTTNPNIPKPENKLPLVLISALALPLSILWYGSVAVPSHPNNPTPLPLLLAVILMGFSLLTTIVPLMSYVVDAFSTYSASATTSVLILRCLMGTFLPLTTGPLTDSLGYRGGFGVIAAVCAVLAPVPALVFWFGERWRGGCVFTRGGDGGREEEEEEEGEEGVRG
ncbi:hypothetical protein KC319_g5539 [Hortaea werneckii]|nr:hypothetical protein KC317_g5695 [Hortaea werneckii]KAI7671539.1 hypothetical protein KC319_g5539 [Hortaea werneckii]KAI7718793.1 hypothetical protein KC322_g2146 [Hortaea werneckii]